MVINGRIGKVGEDAEADGWVGILIWTDGWRGIPGTGGWRGNRDSRGTGGRRRGGARLMSTLGGADGSCLTGKGDGEGDDEDRDQGHEERGSYDNTASRQV